MNQRLPVLPPDSPGGHSTRGSHQLATAAICDRLWNWRYGQRVVKADDKENRIRGTLVHLALAYWYASKMEPHLQPAWFHQKSLRDAIEERGRGYPHLIRLALAILAGYVEHWSTDTFVPVYIETEFSARIGDLDPGGPDSTLDNEVITCRPDLIFKAYDANRGWLYYILDYKTLLGEGRRRADKSVKLFSWSDEGEFALSWQVLVNLHIVRQHMPVETFVYDRILPLDPFDYDRNFPSISAAAYSDAPRVMRYLTGRERALKTLVANGIEPTPSLWACWTRYGACDYRALCLADPEERRKLIETDFRIEG